MLIKSRLLSIAPDAMQKIYENTCIELVRELTDDLINDKPTHDSFTAENGLGFAVEEINFTDNIHSLMKQYHNPNINGGTEAWNALKRLDITKVGKHDMSINDAINIIDTIYEEIGNDLYGVLLMDELPGKDKNIVNILHPVIVSILDREDININKDEKKWTITIFTKTDKFYSRLIDYSSDPKRFYNDKEDTYKTEIAKIIAAINNPSEYVIENRDFKVDIVNNEFVLNYEEVRTLKKDGSVIEGNTSRNYIIPGQVINISGIAYPYYGVIYSRRGLAWNLCPMYGANIGHPHRQSMSNGQEGGSRICTHSGNSKTKQGTSSLNHCNTTSPLNSNCIMPGAFSYANACVEGSIELLTGKTYANKKNEKPMTMAEYLEKHPDATKQEYIKYMKEVLEKQMKQPKQQKQSVKKKIINPAEEGFSKEFGYRYKGVYNSSKTYAYGDVTVVSNYTQPMVSDGTRGTWHHIDTEKGKAILNGVRVEPTITKIEESKEETEDE